MIFADMPGSTSIFLDANVFIYNFGPDPALGPPSRAPAKRGPFYFDLELSCAFWMASTRAVSGPPRK